MCGGLILEGDRTEVRSPLFSKMDLLYGYSGTFSYPLIPQHYYKYNFLST
mgnify:CR=1 FL=1